MDGFKFTIGQQVEFDSGSNSVLGYVDSLLLCRGNVRKALVVYLDMNNVQRNEWWPEEHLRST